VDEATGERAAGDSPALERGLVSAHRCSLERPEVPGKNGAAAEERGVDDRRGVRPAVVEAAGTGVAADAWLGEGERERFILNICLECLGGAL